MLNLVGSLVIVAEGSSLNSAKIIQHTVDALPSCLKWKVIGECFWLKCDLKGCRVQISAKVGHYRPDFVVSVYPTMKSHPIQEVRKAVELFLYGPLNSIPESVAKVLASQGTEPAMTRQDVTRNLRFFESDVTGHPFTNLSVFQSNFYCSSVSTPLKPYYSSIVDSVAWRNPDFESWKNESLVPGRREIGDWPHYTWGSVYPRSGWIIQSSPPKAAAVIAQRAADVAINGGNFRVRKEASNSSSSELRWPLPALRETEANTGKWQMLHPQKSKKCETFGANDVLGLVDWGGGKVDQKNSYVWSLWRPYTCCKKLGQVFLGADDVKGYP